MAATVKYDSVTKRGLSVDTSAPVIMLNESRLAARFGTVSGSLQADSSYPTGGYGPMNYFGFADSSHVAGVFFEDANGYAFYYNKSTDKVQVFSASGTEVANATNLSTLPAVYFEAKGLA